MGFPFFPHLFGAHKHFSKFLAGFYQLVHQSIFY